MAEEFELIITDITRALPKGGALLLLGAYCGIERKNRNKKIK
jgi:hypothetical protein